MKQIFLAIVAIMYLIGCRKTAIITAETTHLTVEIVSPTADATFQRGDTVIIKAHITNDVSIHGFEVKMMNTTQNKVLFDAASHAHGTDIDVQYSLIATGDTLANWTLQVITTLDHSSEPVVTERRFTYRP